MGLAIIRLILIHALFGLQAWAADTAVSGEGQAPPAPTFEQRECRRTYEAAKCADFFQENPELGQYAVDCNHPVDIEKELKACAAGAGEAALELKNLIVAVVGGIAAIPGAIGAPPTEDQQRLNRYYAECVKSISCKIFEYQAASGGHEPGEHMRKLLENLSDPQTLKGIVYNVESQRRTANHRRALEILRTQPDSPERDRQMSEIYPGWTEQKNLKQRSLWEAGYNAGKHLLKAADCYRGDIKVEAMCHGLATIAIPGAALKAGTKLFQIVNVLQRSLRAESLLGRSLNGPQRRAIQAAHEEQDLRRKAEILRNAGFNDTERRKIIEAGIAGDVPAATLTQVHKANLNLGVLEHERMISNRQIQHLRRRLAACEQPASNECSGAVAAVQQEFERGLAAFRKTANELELRLRTQIEAGGGNERLADHLRRIADCARSERPLACNDVFASARQLLNQNRAPAPVTPAAAARTPYQSVQEMEFLTQADRSRFQSLLAQSNNRTAIDRARERAAAAVIHEHTEVQLSKAVESIVGRNPRMGAEQSKAFLESANGRHRVVFDPVNRYFTVKYRAPDGNWAYHQMVPRADGTLRAAAASERVPGGSNSAEWIRMTHFNY
jgi:hypothetical protein